MDPLAEQPELLTAGLAMDDDLAVEDVPAGREAQLGEVAGQVAAVARLELDLVAVDEGDRPEAVPLGLVRPAVARRECRARAGELGEDRTLEGKGHEPDPNQGGRSVPRVGSGSRADGRRRGGSRRRGAGP